MAFIDRTGQKQHITYTCSKCGIVIKAGDFEGETEWVAAGYLWAACPRCKQKRVFDGKIEWSKQ